MVIFALKSIGWLLLLIAETDQAMAPPMIDTISSNQTSLPVTTENGCLNATEMKTGSEHMEYSEWHALAVQGS